MKGKRFLAVLLTAAMLSTTGNVSVMAEELTTEEISAEEEMFSESEEDPSQLQIQEDEINDSGKNTGENSFSDGTEDDFESIEEETDAVGRTVTGYCGDNLTYTFDYSTGKLNISGTGPMYDRDASYSSGFWTGATEVTMSSGITYIGARAFMSTEKLKSITIPDTVTGIGEAAFEYCYSLETVRLPSGLTEISNFLFDNCTKLKNITIPSKVEKIGWGAFCSCTVLEEITIPSKVKKIENYAFAYCDSLSKVTIPSSVEDIGGRAFDRTPWLKSLGEFAIVNNILLAYQGTATEVTVPDSVKKISSAFGGNKKVTSVTLPEQVVCIGDFAFMDCTSLLNVNIPSAVTEISERAFYHCSSLTEIEIPSKVTQMGVSAFGFCSGLKKITFYGDRLELKDDEHCFNGVTADGYYPAGNATWKDVSSSYGQGNFIWHEMSGKSIEAKLEKDSYQYTGKEIRPKVTVTCEGKTLKEGTDYTVSYKNNVEVGTGTVQVTGLGDYGSTSITFKIAELKDINNARFEGEQGDNWDFVYTGKAITPNVLVFYPDGENNKEVMLAKNRDYTIAYEKNKDWGTAKIIITGKGDYKGTWEHEFNIVPPEVQNIQTESRIKNGIKVIWDKIAKPEEAVDYYEIEYSKGTDKAEKIQVEADSSQREKQQSCVIRNLEGNAEYTIKVYACKNFKNNIYRGTCKEEKIQKITASTDIGDMWRFDNSKRTFTLSNVKKLYSRSYAEEVFKKLGEKSAICNGLVTSAMTSLEKNTPPVNTFGISTEGEPTEYVESLNDISDLEYPPVVNSKYPYLSGLDYVRYAHLIQYHPQAEKQLQDNKNKIQEIVNAVKAYENGSGGPVTIAFKDNPKKGESSKIEKGHAVLGLKVTKDNAKETVIDVYDTMHLYYGNSPKLYTPSEVIFYKENGVYTGWLFEGTTEFHFQGNIYGEDWVSYKTIEPSLYAQFIQNGLKFNETDFNGWSLLSVEEKEKLNMEDYLEGSRDTVPIESMNGDETDTSGTLAWVQPENDTITLHNFPAGTEVGLSSAEHSIKVTVAENADITLKVGDTKENAVQISAENGAEYKVSLCDYQADGNGVEKTVISGTTESANLKIEQNTEEIKITGSDSFTYNTEAGDENEEGKITIPIKGTVTIKDRTDGEYTVRNTEDTVEVKAGDQVIASGKRVTGNLLTDYTLTLDQSKFYYNGLPNTPTVTLKNSEGTLKEDRDYTVTYVSNVKVGTAKVIVKGKGNYIGTLEKNFTIARSDISVWAFINLSRSTYTYDGKEKRPSVSVYNAKTLKRNVDYKISYKNNKNIGTATVIIQGLGGYYGTDRKTFRILPAKSGITKLTAGSRRLNIRWKSVKKQTSGYQIQYCTDGHYKKSKTITIRFNKTTSYTLKKLKAGKNYYVRVRTYKTVGGKKYYSDWSGTKWRKIKK